MQSAPRGNSILKQSADSVNNQKMWLKGDFKIISLFCDSQNVQDYKSISKILLKQKKEYYF